ncbi:uncharacterized protein LOC111603815 isoform X1 [Drosophila hydei]|uniref:Uncharacterized protein LOC111603815 isoform X1 n=1 Tax=Drosophila hydei TaxID=7224 RepID=A0A6J1MAF3_DROHY|nr:uncharacterized protein LOC111603815 isoform X1 [Drosophila hydei]
MFALFGAALLLLLQATLAPAQLITLRDGKVGVNFAGFHADAGLGGLLTGNTAHGGLSASAGTPWGSRAAAGLGGGLNGRTAGGAYAAAQANDEVGASALLGGSVGEHGYIGSEAHAPGRKAVHSISHGQQHVTLGPATVEDTPPVVPTAGPPTYVQKVKPPKKYSLIAQNSDHRATSQINENHAETAAVPATEQAPSPLIIVKRPRLHVKRLRQRQRNVYITQAAQEEQQPHEPETVATASHADEPAKASPKNEAKVVHKYAQVANQRPQGVSHHVVAPQAQGVVGQALDIPIGILRSLQQSLGGLIGGQSAVIQPNGQPLQG